MVFRIERCSQGLQDYLDILYLLASVLGCVISRPGHARNPVPSCFNISVSTYLFIFRLCDQFRRHREDFARVAPYAVADILRCFQDFPPPHPLVKANLLSAVRLET